MNIVRDIQTLSEFKQNASKLVKQVNETGEPLVLTVNGKPVAVLQDVNSYQQLVDENDRSKTVRILNRRIANVRNGAKLIPAEEVFANLSEKLGISFE